MDFLCGNNSTHAGKIVLPRAKYSLWYIYFPVVSTTIENSCSPDSCRTITPVRVKMGNTRVGAIQSDLMWLVFGVPRPMVFTAITQWNTISIILWWNLVQRRQHRISTYLRLRCLWKGRESRRQWWFESIVWAFIAWHIGVGFRIHFVLHARFYHSENEKIIM